MSRYYFGKIEKKWQKFWREKKVYEPLDMTRDRPLDMTRDRPLDMTRDRPLDMTRNKPSLKSPASQQKPFYNLMMFPYPSAEGLHVGNMYAFTGSDIYGRFKRMQNYDVFEPIGLDGFGIHSENYALKIGAHPMKQAKISEKRFYKQLEMIGNGFSWDERLETYDPNYYRWTQWIFIQLFKHGLAYRKKAPVNWCPSCKTVLADEQVILRTVKNDPEQMRGIGVCERCETPVIKKELEQWFFKITKYADKLLKNLDKIDWSERVKIAQRNWIGKSKGAEIEFRIKNYESSIKVFTTRPDTLFGATYIVLAPEHPLLENLNIKAQISNKKEVEDYIKKTKNKSEEDRIIQGGNSSTDSGQGKTGVELKGIKAINPANKEETPVWVADYVLGNVGTGAIMAVPAHDERDFEFAKKFNLPIKQVIAPHFIDTENPPQDGKKRAPRRVVQGIIKHWNENKILQLQWIEFPWKTFVIGGAEKGEQLEEAVKREIYEETGFKNFKSIKKIGGEMRSEFYAAHKDVNRYAEMHVFYLELADGEQDEVSDEEKQKHKLVWVPFGDISTSYSPIAELAHVLKAFKEGEQAYTGEGIIINSGKFNEFVSEEAKLEITKFVGGKTKIQYRLRDWLISRQRYWGVPIPMVYCEQCDWQPVPEKDLPVKLPYVKDFRPKGLPAGRQEKAVSPLAFVKSFYETKCPKCGGAARRETDVSDTFLDSAWYYLRYPSTRFNRSEKAPWSLEITKKWLPVNMYIGGAEHSVLHLLYSRFLAMVFNDWGLVHFKNGEPFTVFRAHGLLISEGKKMSKSKGNVVNPDFYIKKFGADAFRMYIMFIAPFEQGGDFRDAGILGITRFLERVWKMFSDNKQEKSNTNNDFEKSLHQAIKKITEDIENLHYNTAISALMILLSKMEEQKNKLSTNTRKIFLKLLAPFAPHITEELWHNLGFKQSIHKESWPIYDPKLIKEEVFKLVVQVNGKTRDIIIIDKGISQKEARKIALSLENIKRHIKNKNIKKIIFVKDRLINFVI